jgi:hypothetical protein
MKPLNSLAVISWHTPWKCVRMLVGKAVIIAVLAVMSGMDPHMISGNTAMGNGDVLAGLCRSGFLLGCGSVTMRLCDAIEVSSLRR